MGDGGRCPHFECVTRLLSLSKKAADEESFSGETVRSFKLRSTTHPVFVRQPADESTPLKRGILRLPAVHTLPWTKINLNTRTTFAILDKPQSPLTRGVPPLNGDLFSVVPYATEKTLGNETIGVLLGQNEMSPPIYWWATAVVALILSASHGY